MKYKLLFLLILVSTFSVAKKDFIIPEALLKQVEQGNAEIAYFISNSFFDGSQDFKADVKKGKSWLKKAATMGNPHAILDYADVLDEEDKKHEALVWYKKAADLGMGYALTKIATYHYHGYAGFKKDCQIAYQWYKKAEKKKDEMAYNNHAWSLATAEDENCRNPEKAIKVIFDLLSTYGQDVVPWYVWDTKAAVLAGVSDFGQAIGLQSWIIETMKEAGLDIKNYQEHLDSYQKRQPWIEINKVTEQ